MKPKNNLQLLKKKMVEILDLEKKNQHQILHFINSHVKKGVVKATPFNIF